MASGLIICWCGAGRVVRDEVWVRSFLLFDRDIQATEMFKRSQEFCPGHIASVNRAGWPCQRPNPSVQRLHKSVSPMATPTQRFCCMQRHNLEMCRRYISDILNLQRSLSVLHRASFATVLIAFLQLSISPVHRHIEEFFHTLCLPINFPVPNIRKQSTGTCLFASDVRLANASKRSCPVCLPTVQSIDASPACHAIGSRRPRNPK